MKALHMIAFILLAVGGINWGLIGLGGFMNADWNVLGMILGSMPSVLWAIYVLVGISAVWLLITHKRNCKECSM